MRLCHWNGGFREEHTVAVSGWMGEVGQSMSREKRAGAGAGYVQGVGGEALG